MEQYWYETQESAFAPGIADGWPKVIKAPHTKNGRLVRRSGDPLELLAALKALVSEFQHAGVVDIPSSFDIAVVEKARAAIAKAAA